MKVSVIGARSFLASYIIPSLQSNPAVELTLYGRSVEPIAHTNVRRYDYPDVTLAYDELKNSDAIIFCVAAGVQSGIKTPEAGVYELNAFEPIRLLTFLKDAQYRGIVITFGSYFEIGNNDIVKLFSEFDVLNSDRIKPNDYALSKSLFSKFMFHQIQRKSEITFTLCHLLLSTIYGKGEQENRIIPYIIKNVREQLPFVLSEGKQIRQYTHVSDVARFVCKLITMKDCSGIYNITESKTISIRYLADQVIALAEDQFATKASVAFNLQGRQDLAMQYLALDPALATQRLGWSPVTNLEHGIQEYFK